MARDYKHRATGQKRRKPVSPWLGLSVGMLVGLFVAFLVYIKMLAPNTPSQQDGISDITAQVSTPEAGATAEEPGAPSPTPSKPRFVFYSELPELEVIVPEEEIRARTTAQPPPAIPEKPATLDTKPAATLDTKPAAAVETFYLQAGSFKGAEQADRFKAKLALMGFETDIQTITINNRDTYHRVRVGPFNDLRTLDRARSRLRKEGIETRTVKIKG